MTLHQAIKNSNGISKLVKLVGGKEELVINATEAIINKNMKGLTKEKKEKCINDKTYIENQIVGIMEALKNGSTIYYNIYDKTDCDCDWFEGTVPMYEKALEEEEEFERIKKELSENDETCKRIFEEDEKTDENIRKIKEKIKKVKRSMGFSNEEEEKEFDERMKKEREKRLNEKDFIDYVAAPFKYIGRKIVKAAKFIKEKISDGFNKLKGLFGKKDAKETNK